MDIRYFEDFAHRPIEHLQMWMPISDEELQASLGGHPNTVGWLLWHTGRELDIQLAHLRGEDELWPRYRDSFGLGELGGSMGYGHTPEQARAIVYTDAARMIDYIAQCLELCSTYTAGLSPEECDEIIDRSFTPHVTRATRLVSIIDDAIAHIGQVEYILGAVRAKTQG